MGTQVTIAASQVDKERLGYCAISLTHFDDTSEPSIAAGSKVEVGGALYEFTADETGTGWGGIGASNNAYFLLTPAGASISWSYTTTAPTWDTAKQGWYTGSNRVFGFLWKDAGGLYERKTILGPLTSDMGKLRHLPLDNTVSRVLINAVVPPAAFSWSGPYTATSVAGVPSIAKGILAKVNVAAYGTAAGQLRIIIGFSDNNSNMAGANTSHPVAEVSGYVSAAAQIPETYTELKIPLNSSGQIYFCNASSTNVTLANSLVNAAVVGFYIGD